AWKYGAVGGKGSDGIITCVNASAGTSNPCHNWYEHNTDDISDWKFRTISLISRSPSKCTSKAQFCVSAHLRNWSIASTESNRTKDFPPFFCNRSPISSHFRGISVSG